MKILVIPDIHGRKFWRNAIKNNADKVEKIIFLGDYLDPYPIEIEEHPETMECESFYDNKGLESILNDIISLKKNEPNKYILLTGNHSDSYIWKDFNKATRTDKLNYEIYHNIFKENLNLFNLVWIENDVIFSHAGITEGWTNFVWEKMEYPENELSSVKEIAELFRDTLLADFDKNYLNVISCISRYRGGSYIYGSCEWADLAEHIDMKNSTYNNIIPRGEDGVFQIFGHSQLKDNPMITDKWACLDCRRGFIVDTNTHEICELN